MGSSTVRFQEGRLFSVRSIESRPLESVYQDSRVFNVGAEYTATISFPTPSCVGMGPIVCSTSNPVVSDAHRRTEIAAHEVTKGEEGEGLCGHCAFFKHKKVCVCVCVCVRACVVENAFARVF